MRASARVGVAGIAVLVVLVVLAVVATGLLVLRPLFDGTRLQQALEVLPASVERVTFTDWEQVREAADGTSLGAESSPEDLDAFTDRAYDQDLAVASALTSTFPGMAAAYGVTPLDAEYEVYGQSREGAVAILRMQDDVDLGAVEDRLGDLGYQAPPDGAGDGGTWVGTPELVVSQDPALTILQENLAVLPDEHLLVMADDPAYVDLAVGAVRGDEPRLDDQEDLGDLLEAVEDPATATVWVGDFACEDLAMSQASRADATEGERLVEEAGGVSPLAGLVLAADADGTLSFVMDFETEAQASEDLQPRTDLASGPAPGQGGTFPERFEITSSTADGSVITMRARPVGGPALADIGSGPVLFATC